MCKRLFFVEFEDEADSLARRSADRIEKEDRFLALSPPVQAILKRLGIPYLNSLPFFDNQSHQRALDFSERCLERIEGEALLEDTLSRELSHCLRFHLNYLAWLVEVLSKSIDEFQPCRLMIPQSSSDQMERGWKLDASNRPLGQLSTILAETYNLEYQVYNQGLTALPGSAERREANYPEASRALSLLSSLAIRFLGRWTREKHVLILGDPGYGLDQLVEDVCGRLGRGVVFAIDGRPVDSPLAGAKRLLKWWLKFLLSQKAQTLELPLFAFEPDCRELEVHRREIQESLREIAQRVVSDWKSDFEYLGIDLSSLVARRIRFGFLSHFQNLLAAETRLEALLRMLKPAIAFSPHSAGFTGILGGVCKELQVPSVMIPHGSLTAPKNRFEEIEMRRLSRGQMLSEYQFAAAQTPLAEAHAAHFNLVKRTFKSGPLLFTKARSDLRETVRERLGIDSAKRMILYAVAQRKRSSMRFQVFETEDEVVASLSDIVTATSSIENAHLIIKLHPSSEYKEPDLRVLLPERQNLTVAHREPFVEILSAADLLVSSFSTTVEEALLSQLPVVLYDKWARYCQVDALHCHSRLAVPWNVAAAYYVTEPEMLAMALNHALASVDAAMAQGCYDRYRFSDKEVVSLSSVATSILEKGGLPSIE